MLLCKLKELQQNARIFYALQMGYFSVYCPPLVEKEARKQLGQCKSKCRELCCNGRFQ